MSVSPILGAVSISGVDWTYSQDFNSLNGVGTWSNDTTLAGWFARTDSTSSITTLGSSTGTSTTAGLYSFGVAGTNAVSERSIGFVTSNSFTGSAGTGRNLLGVQFSNDTIYTMNEFTVGYDGEQWRREGNTSAHTIVVEYSLNATSLTTGTWVSAGSTLDFSSPQTGSSASALDGNASANRVAGLSDTITSISWAPGTNLWIRFVDLNNSGNDHHLTVDNFVFSTIPEPTAALLGAVGLLGILRRRR